MSGIELGTVLPEDDQLKRVRIPFVGGDDTAAGIVNWTNPEASPIALLLEAFVTTHIATAACTVDGISAQGTDFTFDAHSGLIAGSSADQVSGTGHCSVIPVDGTFVMQKASGASAGLIGYLTLVYFVLS